MEKKANRGLRVPLGKKLKARLLLAIRDGEFYTGDFPELVKPIEFWELLTDINEDEHELQTK